MIIQKEVVVIDGLTGEVYGKHQKKRKRTEAFYMTTQESSIELAKMKLTGMEYSILLYLQGLEDYENTVYGLSQVKLAADLQTTEATISLALKHLEELSLIRKDKNRGHVAFIVSPKVSTRGKVK